MQICHSLLNRSLNSQAFAARLGALLSALLPHVSDVDWMTGGQGESGGESEDVSMANRQKLSTVLTVERAMRALIKLTCGCDLEDLTPQQEPIGPQPETPEEEAVSPPFEPTDVPEAAQHILPWVAAVWGGAGQEGSAQPLAFLQVAAQLASTAPWAKGGPYLPPTLRLRCLLTVLSAHCHFVSGQPTEGGLWVWRFISGPGGQQLTTLLSGDSPDSQLLSEQVWATTASSPCCPRDCSSFN
jgi:hypothetical protein